MNPVDIYFNASIKSHTMEKIFDKPDGLEDNIKLDFYSLSLRNKNEIHLNDIFDFNINWDASYSNDINGINWPSAIIAKIGGELHWKVYNNIGIYAGASIETTYLDIDKCFYAIAELPVIGVNLQHRFIDNPEYIMKFNCSASPIQSQEILLGDTFKYSDNDYKINANFSITKDTPNFDYIFAIEYAYSHATFNHQTEGDYNWQHSSIGLSCGLLI